MAATTTAAAYAIATTIESLQQTKITMGYHSSAAIFLKKDTTNILHKAARILLLN